MGLIGHGGPAPRRRARSLEAGILLLRLRAAHARTRPLASGFFGICGGRTRRAASSRAASGCATGAARRAAPRGRVGVASGFVLACARRFWLLARAAGLWLLRHLRRPRAARGVESRRVGLRDGRGASGCAARPRQRTRTRDIFGSCCHCLVSVCGRA